jgi:diamine N-acetyltransferase
MVDSFHQRVIKAIRKIPSGRVATYGQIAAMAGNPRAARQVVRTLHTASDKEKLPWHRVINGKGQISLRPGSGYEIQKAMLEDEEVCLSINDTIDLDRFLWVPAQKKKNHGRPMVEAMEIGFRPTSKSDIKKVITMERDRANKPFIRQWSQEQHLNALKDGNFAHLVIETPESGRMIGYAILIGLENPDKSIEFKRLVINEKGKGFGRMIMRMMKTHVFETLRAHRLWLEVKEGNERAFRLYQSEGFIVEGVHRECFLDRGKFSNLIVMSMLANEYSNISSN